MRRPIPAAMAAFSCLIIQGKKLYRGQSLAPLTMIELIVFCMILGIVAAIALRPDQNAYLERINEIEKQPSPPSQHTGGSARA